MEALLDDYRENIGDTAYHRLKTSDNVSKYRPFIVETLKDLLQNDEFIEVIGAFTIRLYCNRVKSKYKINKLNIQVTK